MVAKYLTAKEFCVRPFEVPAGGRKRVYTSDEWIGRRSSGNGRPSRKVDLRCGSATEAEFECGSLDAVFTDPPYYDSVQYAELMDFCYVWLRRLVGAETEAFAAESTRNGDELTGNETEGRDLAHFTEGLARVYARMARALKPGAPLAFTYHHNRRSAYHAVGVAVLDAGLSVTATIPCPAEMSGSIHISGTKSAIVDTIFVCRSGPCAPGSDPVRETECLEDLLAIDVARLRAGGVKPRSGDVRCLALGHLTRLAVVGHRASWDRTISTGSKIARMAESMDQVAVDPVVDRVLSARTSVTCSRIESRTICLRPRFHTTDRAGGNRYRVGSRIPTSSPRIPFRPWGSSKPR